MKTGFGESSGAYEERQLEAITDILIPVLEKSMLLACKYCRACGRDVVLSQDVEYAAKYCAMNTVGQDIGTSIIEDEERGRGRGRGRGQQRGDRGRRGLSPVRQI
jgi:hypothetical protein